MEQKSFYDLGEPDTPAVARAAFYAFREMSRNFERVQTKLAEAEFFLTKLEGCGPNIFEVQCYLGAFAGSARGVTYALQVAMAGVPGFEAWYAEERRRLRDDGGARWFHALRNANQHQGLWHVVAGSMNRRPDGDLAYRHWAIAEEDDADQFDVADAGRRQYELLANIVERAAAEFPKAADPLWIFDVANLASEGMSVEDLEEALGYPRGWTDVGGTVEERLRALSLRA